MDFLGNFYMSNTTDVELATVDCDKSITCEIKHDDKLNEAEGAYVQVHINYKWYICLSIVNSLRLGAATPWHWCVIMGYYVSNESKFHVPLCCVLDGSEEGGKG